MALTLFSPAKINLFFRVLGKRLDGYHEVATVMQAVSLGDEVTLTPARFDHLSCSDPSLCCGETNLAWKALALFRRKTGCHQAFHIHLNKRIPQEAGLGGGSSNSATVLWGLNQLTDQQVSVARLQQWAAELSSDAPFFFSLGTAYATGRNEKIALLAPLLYEQAVIARPDWGMSTPAVYAQCSRALCSTIDPQKLVAACQAADFSHCVNDLEPPAFTLKPHMRALKQALLDLGFRFVLMTGSGSAFYCLGTPSQALSPASSPLLSGVSFFHVSFISRSTDHWFCAPRAWK